MMECKDTALRVIIKTENQEECDEKDEPNQIEHKSTAISSACHDRDFQSPPSCSENIEMKHSFDSDVDFVAASTVQISEKIDCTSADMEGEIDNREMKIKVEQTLDMDEPEHCNRDIKKEYIPSSAVNTNEPEIANDKTGNGSADKLHEHVYADGFIYEVREVVEDDQKEPIQKAPTPTSAGAEQPRETMQSSIMCRIQQLGQNKQFKCDQCEKSFCDKMELKIHKRNHQLTVCPVCKRTMRTDFVKRHIARVHPADGILPKDRSHPCSECDRTFPNDVQLKNHQLSHKRQECTLCGKIVRSDYFKRHMDLNHPEEVNSSDGTSYPCDQCDAVLGNRYLLFFHKRSHQTEECPVCKETLRAGYLKIHIDMKHPDHSTLPNDAPFKCDQCAQSFGLKAALTLHKRKHRFTACPVCGKTFRADCLKRHMGFHHPNEVSSALPDANHSSSTNGSQSDTACDKRSQPTTNCSECGESFRSDYLKMHMALKHPDDSTLPEDRPFKCDQCDKTFTHKTQLRLHKRNHQVAECPVCKKSMKLQCVRLHVARMHSNVST